MKLAHAALLTGLAIALLFGTALDVLPACSQAALRSS